VDLVEEILTGRPRAIARCIRNLEDDPQRAHQVLKKLYPHTGRAYLIGLTGSPGVGKSTLVDRLISRFRSQGLSVGVTAVDPTSPFSGGSLLGDRVRMQRHATDEGVFIRSLATRGAFGGLAPAAKGAVQVLDAAGFDRIIIETVGVGQDEVDIVGLAHTTLVITVPGLGDGIQAIKAGILEIADILAVNKADRPGVEQTIQELASMLELNRLTGQERLWWPEVLAISAASETGLEELFAAIDRHRDFLLHAHPEALAKKRRVQLKALILDLVRERVLARTQARLEKNPAWEERLEEVVERRNDPYSLAEELIQEELVRGGLDA